MKSVDIDIEVNRAIEAGRVDSEESANEILRRLLGIDARPIVRRERRERSSGAYSTVLGDTPIEANSLKELLRRVILAGAKIRPDFIEALAVAPTAKGRYIVARTPQGVYPRNSHLVEYAAKLDEVWWYDSNVGRSQVAAYLRKFAKMLNLPNVPTINKRSEKSVLTLADLDLD